MQPICISNLVGVTKPEGAQPVEVLLETTYLPSRYLETRPIHPSQRLLRQEDERYVFALRVIVNPELVNELVRFGNDVKVAAPVALKEMVERRLG
jgi:predicted DNA-binding transcriptional regulator YafY